MSFVSGNSSLSPVFHVEQYEDLLRANDDDFVQKGERLQRLYDVVVIGGGHAGCEAALASSRMGVRTLLVTMDPTKIAEMSCNPSIGGVGKGQLVREIDALGGEMGKNADFTGIHFKRLNTRKGSAVQSSRCQSDKKLYAQRMQEVLAQQNLLTVMRGEVKRINIQDNKIAGITLLNDDSGHLLEIPAGSVVITAGTFMKGLMHCGDHKSGGGRHGEQPSLGLSDCLSSLGLNLMRLKTGTPPRLLKHSIDFSQMSQQWGDDPPHLFSFSKTEISLPQLPCHLTFTNPDTHAVIAANLARSPLFSGQIKGIGPRYCPSIEDKVVKFPQKPRHQLFFEPEALDSDWIYPNGISTSLPADVQEQFVRTLPGCQNVEFARYGYAVEYDCADPRQLKPTLETLAIGGLFLAGQVNGTSGYEEAAAQGLMAGINAALRTLGAAPFILDRSRAYIGVMIDDLIHLGVNEPYRMFTSRAEFRLSLREDNADLRLRQYGFRLGLVSSEDFERFEERAGEIKECKIFLSKTLVRPTAENNAWLESLGTTPITEAIPMSQLLKRPEIGLEDVYSLVFGAKCPEHAQTRETLEVEVKYSGYIEMQRLEIERLKKMDEWAIPPFFDFQSVAGLSFELREKLSKQQPKSLSEAARVSGVTPAALSALLFHLRKKQSHESPVIT
jgi:tRNA uridine 5-carboxymethylaminomethyl modification enzyme